MLLLIIIRLTAIIAVVNCASSCHTDNDCASNNDICISGQCLTYCSDNYKWNARTQRCELLYCQSNYECLNIDINSVCNDNKCECSPGYILSDISKCTEISSTYGIVCSDSTYCYGFTYADEKCVDSVCECSPNYKYDTQSGRCLQYSCSNDIECRTYDNNRHCMRGQCECSHNFKANHTNGDKCDKNKVLNIKSNTYNKICFADYTCSESYQRCIDNYCKCKPDYVWDETDQRCKRFTVQTRRVLIALQMRTIRGDAIIRPIDVFAIPAIMKIIVMAKSVLPINILVSIVIISGYMLAFPLELY